MIVKHGILLKLTRNIAKIAINYQHDTFFFQNVVKSSTLKSIIGTFFYFNKKL